MSVSPFDKIFFALAWWRPTIPEADCPWEKLLKRLPSSYAGFTSTVRSVLSTNSRMDLK